MQHKMAAIKNVSQIIYPEPVWKYVLLFQSWSQLISWLFVVMLTSFIMLHLFTDLNELASTLELVIGVAFGSLGSILLVLPARFQVSTRSTIAVKSVIQALANVHYVESHKTSHGVYYRQALPKFLRWREGQVIVRQDSDCIVIDGPRVVLGRVRAELMSLA